MSSKKKALVIRFNAIGDIVLTSPCLKALSDAGYLVHYLTKASFAEILTHNVYVDKVWKLERELSTLLPSLREEAYNVVIDLHNNLRSSQVKSALSCQAHTLQKNRIPLWILTQTPFKNHMEKHIVTRFLDVLKPLGIIISNPETSYALPKSLSQNEKLISLPKNYLAIAVGAAWKTKTIPSDKILSIIEKSGFSDIVLIGGPDEMEKASEVMVRSKRPVINLVGHLSINESAFVINGSSVLLTGDTGMMHIAAALGVPTVAVFASTHPALGYTPFYSETRASAGPTHYLIQNENLRCRPCTKQGKAHCPKGHFRCMLDLDNSEIVEKINSFI